MSESMAWVGMLQGMTVFIDWNRVNLDDLIEAGPGAIVRCEGNPHDAVMIHVAPQDEYIGCIGGMISDAE
jgi:hypothetical protein